MRVLRDRVAAVTGAGSGIGRALAEALAGEGCRLALSDVDGDGLAETGRIVAGLGATVDIELVDVADRAAVHAWADRLAREVCPVQLLINNAGVSVSATAESISYEDFEWVMNVNFWGVVHGTRAFLPQLKRVGNGCIVNVSSALGLVAMPRLAAYVSSKFAIRGFTETLRQELELEGSDVTVIGVYPGFVKTGIARAARVSGPEVLGLDRRQLLDSFDRVARTSADRAARAIVRGVKRNRPRIRIGADAHFGDLVQRISPEACHRFIVRRTRPDRKGRK